MHQVELMHLSEPHGMARAVPLIAGVPGSLVGELICRPRMDTPCHQRTAFFSP
jgi:hypothetical protein